MLTFTAGASLGESTVPYCGRVSNTYVNLSVRPAIDWLCYTNCHATCDCSDLVSGAKGACLRACRAECLQGCQ
jgi:hypothetical protein